MDNIFLQMSALLGITVVIAFIVRILRQPLMIAYIVAGIVSGPLLLNIIHGDMELFNSFAELGVVLLLFVVGLSLNFRYLKRIGRISVIVGVSQVAFTSLVGFAILSLFPQLSFIARGYLAVAITFSSTIIITKLLTDKKDMQSVYGRNAIGLMVVQDVIAVLIMLSLSTVSAGASLSTAISTFIVKGLAMITAIVILARYVVPLLLSQVAKSGEFLFIFTIAWCFGIASAIYALGFSIEIGAMMAGISLGSSPYQPEIASRIRPLRDFFIVLFFLILGSQMQIADLATTATPGVILSIFILIGNPLILYFLYRIMKFTRRNSFLSGVTSAQVSEFGFVLLFTGIQLGHITDKEIQIFTFTALITIFVSSYIITYNEQIYRFLLPLFNKFGKDKNRQEESTKETYDVWVFGYHRIGWKVCDALEERGSSFAVVDFNPVAIDKLKRRGIPHFFGDAADVEFLEELPLDKAKMVISTLPEPDDQEVLIRHVKHKKRSVKMIANLYHSMYLDDLYRAGADYVMMPHLLGGQWIATILKDKPWTTSTFGNLKKEQKSEMKLRTSSGKVN